MYEAYKMAASSSKVSKQVTSYNFQSWIQKSSVYFPRLLYRCISQFIAFIYRLTSTFKLELLIRCY